MKGIELIVEAYHFADGAHNDQIRKYTGEPYIVHPIAVADLVMSVGGTPEMIAAALLHDVVEDCGIEIETIDKMFGRTVGDYVFMLTDYPGPGNRAHRKALTKDRLAYSSPEVQTLKVADLIDNTKSILEHDPDFAKVYIREKLDLLQVLTEADPKLILMTNKQLRKYNVH